MFDFLNGYGFLGTKATFRTDATLILVLTSAVLLTIGWRLAVHKHYTAHRWVQTFAVLLNATVVLSTMIRTFALFILPGIPEKLGDRIIGLTTVHAQTGAIGLALGLFVVLRANGLMPKSLQFKNYKLFMRTSYVLYMLATLMGITVYIMTYIL